MVGHEQKPLVFVSGASAFLGLNIVHQLLEAGYAVKGAARGSKLAGLSKALAKYGKDFEAVNVPDISETDLAQILKGVSSVVHVAAPLPMRADKETALKSAVEGSLHVIREAEKAGVKNVVVTGSVVTYPTGGPYGDLDYRSITIEEVSEDDPWMIYFAEKTFASKAVAKFAQEHPHLKITEVNSPYFYGPLAEGFEEINSTTNLSALSTDAHIYSLFDKSQKDFPIAGGYLDTRDIARAHIAGITRSGSGYCRVIVAAPHENSFKEAHKFIYEERPQLRSRLISADSVPVFSSNKLDYDVKASEKALGLEGVPYKLWKETVLDTVDSILRVETAWKTQSAAKF